MIERQFWVFGKVKKEGLTLVVREKFVVMGRKDGFTHPFIFFFFLFCFILVFLRFRRVEGS